MSSYYKAMLFFWHLSEKHWLLKPFEWIGNWMEDYGLDHGYIRLKEDIIDEIKEARKEEAQFLIGYDLNQDEVNKAKESARRIVHKYKRLGDLLAEDD